MDSISSLDVYTMHIDGCDNYAFIMYYKPQKTIYTYDPYSTFCLGYKVIAMHHIMMQHNLIPKNIEEQIDPSEWKKIGSLLGTYLLRRIKNKNTYILPMEGVSAIVREIPEFSDNLYNHQDMKIDCKKIQNLYMIQQLYENPCYEWGIKTIKTDTLNKEELWINQRIKIKKNDTFIIEVLEQENIFIQESDSCVIVKTDKNESVTLSTIGDLLFCSEFPKIIFYPYTIDDEYDENFIELCLIPVYNHLNYETLKIKKDYLDVLNTFLSRITKRKLPN